VFKAISHIATDEDWQLLVFTLGMDAEELDITVYRGQELGVGNNLKFEAEWTETGFSNFNSSAFDALLGGDRSGFDGIFCGRNITGFWWTSK
jgi:hypothetical protein